MTTFFLLLLVMQNALPQHEVWQHYSNILFNLCTTSTGTNFNPLSSGIGHIDRSPEDHNFGMDGRVAYDGLFVIVWILMNWNGK